MPKKALKRLQFPLFQTPLDLAHSYWQKLLKPGDCAIDATCGNGHDTLFLANLILGENDEGSLVAIDKQKEAVESTLKLLKTKLTTSLWNRISFYNQCHSSFPVNLDKESVSLIVYNLGYLPGGDKSVTTLRSTTLQSLETATSLIKPGGAISLTCYPGHAEGKLEEEIVLKFSTSLDPVDWSCCQHRWLNRLNAPSLIILQRGF